MNCIIVSADQMSEMRFEVDSDVQSVLEFMQSQIQACKLVGVAEALPQMARLLWNHNQQEPVHPCSLTYLGLADVQPPVSSGSGLGTVNAGDGSAAGVACS